MTNYPDGMTRADLIAVGEIEGPREPFPALVLRAVVWIAYRAATESEMQYEDAEPIDETWPPRDAEREILGALLRWLDHSSDGIAVVDAEYMSPAEADAYEPERAAYRRGLEDGRRLGGR